MSMTSVSADAPRLEAMSPSCSHPLGSENRATHLARPIGIGEFAREKKISRFHAPVDEFCENGIHIHLSWLLGRDCILRETRGTHPWTCVSTSYPLADRLCRQDVHLRLSELLG